MKVLLVSHTATLGGAERCLLDLARELVARKRNAVALCPSEGPLTAALAQIGIPVVVRPMRRPRRSVLRLLELLATWPGSVAGLARWMRDQDFTVVYNNTVDSLYAPFAAARLRIPCVWHVHEARPDPTWARRLLGRLLGAFSTRVVFNSVATLEAFAKPGKRPAHWTVVHNGVALAESSPPRSANPGGLVAGFAGDLRPHKRPELFLHALALARRQVPSLRGCVAGDGVLLERARLTVSRLGIAEAVTFRGRVEEMASFYAEIDIFVLTSQREGFGRVVIEAMAAGVPVVAAGVGGVPEVIEEGRSGYLVPPGDAAGFARRIVELAQDAELRRRIGAAGPARVAQRFTLRRYGEAMIGELEAAAAAREPRRGPARASRSAR